MAARRAPRGPQAIETQPETSHVLRISLEGVEPPIWRRLRIRSDATFGDLHRAIQHAVGWQDCHMHQFTVGERRLGRVRDDDGGMGLEDEESTTLTGALPHEGDGCAYEYDFGDSWVHWIQVESVEPKRSQTAFAACLDGARSCPPEDCGGVGGYEDLLKAMRHPRTTEQKELVEWAGPFRPDAFSRATANRALARMFGSGTRTRRSAHLIKGRRR